MNRRLISCIVVLLFVACGSTATDDPVDDTGQSPADTTEPPTDSATPSDIAVPDAKVPSPVDTAVEPDTTEPPVPDITEPPVPDTTEPDTTEPPEPDTTEPPEPDIAEPDTTEPPEPTAITWTSHIQKIINTKCTPCHTSKSKGGLKIKGYQTMDDPSPKCFSNTTVAEAIAIKVQPFPGCKSQMPPYGSPPLSSEQQDQIKAWAEADFPE